MHFIKYMSSPALATLPWGDALWLYDFNGAQTPEGGVFQTPIYTQRKIGTYDGTLNLKHRGYALDLKGPHELLSDEDDYYAETGGDTGDGRTFCYDLTRDYGGTSGWYHGELEQGAWTGQETYTFGTKLKWNSAQQGSGAYWLFASGNQTTYATQVYKDGNDKIGFRMRDTLGNWQLCHATSTPIAFDTSILIACQYDAGTGEMSVWYSVTGSGVITKIGTHTVTQAIANPPANHAYPPHIGALNSGTYGSQLMEGMVDQFWSFGTILTEDEMLILADAWDMSVAYKALTGYEWYPGGLPPVTHLDISWWASCYTKSGFGNPQPGVTDPAATGWTVTPGDAIKTIWGRTGNKVVISTNQSDPPIPLTPGDWPLLRNDANSGNNYLEFRESRTQYAEITWRQFTRKAVVEGTENVDYNNRTYIVVAKTRTGGGGQGGCVYTTTNDGGFSFAWTKNELWLSDTEFKFREVDSNTKAVLTNVTTSDALESTFKVFVVTVDNSVVNIYVDNTTSQGSGTLTALASSGNDTLTSLYFAETWDYNSDTFTTNEYNEDLGELAIYDRALSAAELTAVIADLKAKWNIT